ncbi:hypothetical protein Shyhy01_27490 [Streptomyces hygroscopicus subsp. hygroscopicus]|nr:hypothetical protein [Streptomyces hygroscopicus]GLX49799.1 hypothetical protein Shyhy01_27490 [Streptomyces hygroscopicus subsp. hygroscopicus]
MVDAYGDEEQRTGLFTMLEEYLDVPFTTMVLGVEVTVRGVGLPPLPLPSPVPEEAQWIEACRHWAG